MTQYKRQLVFAGIIDYEFIMDEILIDNKEGEASFFSF